MECLTNVQASLKKTIRALEKQQGKFHKQAQEWGEYGVVQGYGMQAYRAGLAGVKGQLDLIRAFREVHTQEVRQELAQFEAVSTSHCCTLLYLAVPCCTLMDLALYVCLW